MTSYRLPRTLAQATELLSRYAEADGALAQIEAVRKAEIGRINAAADAEAAPMVVMLDAMREKLGPWWAGAGTGLTGGTRKSMVLGGCKLGTRALPAKLMHSFASDAEATEALAMTSLRKLTIVVKESIDKSATLKLLTGKDKAAATLAGMGFAVDGPSEAFFVTRIEQGGTIGG